MWGSQQTDQDQVQKPKFIGDKAATQQLLLMAKAGDAQITGQREINQPLAMDNQLEAVNEDFLNLVMEKITTGEINLYETQTLMNKDIYQKLTENEQDQIDIYAVNMLSTIRRIKDLCAAEQKYTYQMQNLLEEFRLRKEATEKTFGDVFII